MLCRLVPDFREQKRLNQKQRLMQYNQNNGTSNIGFLEHHEATINHKSPIINQEDFTFDDLIERQPGWLLNSGILLLFGAAILAVTLASFIRYPDKLAAPFPLTTENPPIDVVTLSGGQIARWYVTDSQQVAKDGALAYIDNTANLEDVKTFAAFVEAVAAINYIPDHRKLQIPKDLQMGDLR